MQIDIAVLRKNEIDCLNSLEPIQYTPGKSIVTTCYHKEVASMWILLNELVRLGCALPVEIFYRTGELDDKEINLLLSVSPNVKIKLIKGDPKDFISQYGSRHGWACKAYALMESEYAENLWLDADNYPIVDPAFLFDDPEYVKKGSLFWRDMLSPDAANRFCDNSPMWPIFGVMPNDCEPFEAGQLLINKPQCWIEMGLFKYFSDNCEIYYCFGGDPQAFRFAWQRVGFMRGHQQYTINFHSDPNVPFGFMPYGPFHKGKPNQFGKWAGGTIMVQRDRNGKELFNHRNMDRFTLGENVFNDDIINEQYYHQHIEKLRKVI